MDRALSNIATGYNAVSSTAYGTKASVASLKVKIQGLGEYKTVHNVTSFVNQMRPTKESIHNSTASLLKRTAKLRDIPENTRELIGKTGEKAVTFVEDHIQSSGWTKSSERKKAQDKQIDDLTKEVQLAYDENAQLETEKKQLTTDNEKLINKNANLQQTNDDLAAKNRSLEFELYKLQHKKKGGFFSRNS